MRPISTETLSKLEIGAMTLGNFIKNKHVQEHVNKMYKKICRKFCMYLKMCLGP